MSARADRHRGEPLLVLVALLVAWVGARAMMWETPRGTREAVPDRVGRPVLARHAAPRTAHPAGAVLAIRTGARPDLGPRAPGLQPLLPHQISPLDGLPTWHVPATNGPSPPSGSKVMAKHQLLWLPATPVAAQKPDRWSFDTWLLLRPGGTGEAVPGGRLASYGASQVGAVIRYRLAPASPHRATAYARATQALAAGEESEVAAGIAARPLAAVPVSFHSELRGTRHGSGKVELRPATFAVTELPPVSLPLGLRGEAYAQAGYVGGKFATAFADGQARIDREIARFDLAEVRAGAGVWGGAQKDAARLDVGPTASFDFEIGGAPARLALDYRWRIAGEAMPGRGVAVTLSTGF